MFFGMRAQRRRDRQSSEDPVAVENAHELTIARWVEEGQRLFNVWQERVAHMTELQARLQRTLSPTSMTSESANRISTELVIRYLEKPGRYVLRRAQQEGAESEYSSVARFREAYQTSRRPDLSGSNTADNIASEDDEFEDDHVDDDVGLDEDDDE